MRSPCSRSARCSSTSAQLRNLGQQEPLYSAAVLELGGLNALTIAAGGTGIDQRLGLQRHDRRSARTSALRRQDRSRKTKSLPYLQTWAGYQSIRIIAQAVKDANSTDGQKVMEAMRKVRIDNLMGKTVGFDDHNSMGHYVVLQTVKDKKVAVADIVEVK